MVEGKGVDAPAARSAGNLEAPPLPHAAPDGTPRPPASTPTLPQSAKHKRDSTHLRQRSHRMSEKTPEHCAASNGSPHRVEARPVGQPRWPAPRGGRGARLRPLAHRAGRSHPREHHGRRRAAGPGPPGRGRGGCSTPEGPSDAGDGGHDPGRPVSGDQGYERRGSEALHPGALPRAQRGGDAVRATERAMPEEAARAIVELDDRGFRANPWFLGVRTRPDH
jgi:hypothetical protein